MVRCMQRTNIYLEGRQTSGLDEVARQLGLTRAELVRRYVDRGLHDDAGGVDATLAAIDDSFGVLADDDGHREARGPSARDAHLDRLWEQ